MILNGTKTATRRDWKKPMVKIGGIYKCKTKMFSKEYFAKIEVIKLFKDRLGNMTLEDCKKEGYDSQMKFRNIWSKINRGFREDLIVYVIEFKLKKEKNSKKHKCLGCGNPCSRQLCRKCYENPKTKRKGQLGHLMSLKKKK